MVELELEKAFAFAEMDGEDENREEGEMEEGEEKDEDAKDEDAIDGDDGELM